MMHGNMSLKFIDTKQAKEIYHYKNTKMKLYRTNAAIWYNKTCRLKQLTSTYINPYRRLRLQFLLLLRMGVVTPETCRVTLQ